LALQHADCLITSMRDMMTTRLRQAARDAADAQESAARDVAYAQETSATAIMEEQQYHYRKACATRKKHAKQLGLDRRDFAVVVKNLR